MEQALPLPKTNFLFDNKRKERMWLDQLSMKKMSWDQFLQKTGDPLSSSRLSAAENGRSLLHLAVLDDRLDMIEVLSRDPCLKLRRDAFGLSPIELAQLLHRKKALNLLQPLAEATPFSSLPELDPFEYLPHLIFETREGLEQILASVAKAKKEDKIPTEKIWMGSYFDKEIRKGAHPPVSICWIDAEVGYGVFADKKIAPCAYIGEYTGVVQERKPKYLKEKRHCLRYTTWDGKKNFTINAEEKGNFTRFLNHSAEPNLGLQAIYWRWIPRMIFVALKEIKKGAQLTFDYGPLFWKYSRQIPKDFPDDL